MLSTVRPPFCKQELVELSLHKAFPRDSVADKQDLDALAEVIDSSMINPPIAAYKVGKRIAITAEGLEARDGGTFEADTAALAKKVDESLPSAPIGNYDPGA